MWYIARTTDTKAVLIDTDTLERCVYSCAELLIWLRKGNHLLNIDSVGEVIDTNEIVEPYSDRFYTLLQSMRIMRVWGTSANDACFRFNLKHSLLNIYTSSKCIEMQASLCKIQTTDLYVVYGVSDVHIYAEGYWYELSNTAKVIRGIYYDGSAYCVYTGYGYEIDPDFILTPCISEQFAKCNGRITLSEFKRKVLLKNI